MERRTVARALRAIRRRKGWTQAQLGVRIGVSKSQIGRWEASDLDRCSVAELDGWATALNAHIVIDLRVHGERPLTDQRHAHVQNWLVGRLRGAGWTVEPEASFNVFGDRGRIDVLAYYPAVRVVLVVEIKTRIHDAQDLLGRLDVKRRVAPTLARERGWQTQSIVPALFILEGTTARRHIAQHESLFASFSVRARAAMAWLRQPDRQAPRGILALVTPPPS